MQQYYHTQGTRLYYFNCSNKENPLCCIENSIEHEKQMLLKQTGSTDIQSMNSIEKRIEKSHRSLIRTLYKGNSFIELVEKDLLNDSKGVILDIFVDKYVTNLGLYFKNLCQGNFILDIEAWKSLCSHHEVYVNWMDINNEE